MNEAVRVINWIAQSQVRDIARVVGENHARYTQFRVGPHVAHILRKHHQQLIAGRYAWEENRYPNHTIEFQMGLDEILAEVHIFHRHAIPIDALRRYDAAKESDAELLHCPNGVDADYD